MEVEEVERVERVENELVLEVFPVRPSLRVRPTVSDV